jgi:hypothetical protein
MTAATKPGLREGGGALDCHACDLVLMEGGATWAAAIASWALVCTQGDVLVGVAALHSHVAHHFLMHSCLAELVSMLVGITLLSTLGTDGRASMEHVILLLSSMWVAGTSGGVCTLGTCGMLGVCTLGTHCMLGVAEGVATSSKQSGCPCTWACVASMIHWRSCAAWEFLALLVMPCRALTQSANLCITLSAWVMVGLVMRLCWN